jgi:hypothetical protein
VLRRARVDVGAQRYQGHLPPAFVARRYGRAPALMAPPRPTDGMTAAQDRVRRRAVAAARAPGQRAIAALRGPRARPAPPPTPRPAWHIPMHQSAQAPRATPVCQHPMHQFPAPTDTAPTDTPLHAWHNPMHQSAHTPRASPACQEPMHQFPGGGSAVPGWPGSGPDGAAGGCGWVRNASLAHRPYAKLATPEPAKACQSLPPGHLSRWAT